MCIFIFCNSTKSSTTFLIRTRNYLERTLLGRLDVSRPWLGSITNPVQENLTRLSSQYTRRNWADSVPREEMDATNKVFNNQYSKDLVSRRGFLNSDQTLFTLPETRDYNHVRLVAAVFGVGVSVSVNKKNCCSFRRRRRSFNRRRIFFWRSMRRHIV